MKLRKEIKQVISVGIAAIFLLTGCNSNTLLESKNTEDSQTNLSEIYTISDADQDINAENVTKIVFEEGQDSYSITESGAYLLEGSYSGQLQIDVQDEIVHIILKDVNMKSQSGPAIYVKSAAKVVITVPDGSSSVLTDSGYYTDYSEAKACIYSEDDLTINGGGNLHVYGYYKDAIRTKDTLKILGTDLIVQAKGDGLRGNDGVVIQTAALDIQCEGTGIYTEKENKENKGFVDIASGTVKIIAGKKGIDASENVYIHDCQADIYGIVQNISCSGEQYIEEGCLE